MNLVRAEWIKLRSVTSAKVLLGLAVLLGIGFSVLVTLIIPASEMTDALGGPPTQSDLWGLATGGLNFGYLLIGVTGVLMSTQEFRFTARPTFAAEPRRPRVLVAKAVVAAVVGILLGALMTVGSVVLGGLILRARDLPLEFGAPGGSRVIVGSILLAGLFGLAGLGVGALLRASAAAIVVLVLWVVLVEPLLSGFLPKVGQYAPFVAGDQLRQLVPAEPGLGPLIGGLLLTGFVAVLLAAGTLLLVRRDV